MHRHFYVIAPLAAILLLMAGAAVNAEQAASLNGVWQAENAEIDGRKLPAAMVASMRLTLRNGAYQSQSKTLAEEGTYVTNTTMSPHWLDIRSAKGATKGTQTVAIFELAGDTLKICYKIQGGERPESFSTNPGNYQLLVTYKRVK